jgi:dethiobiotin synthetase
MSAVFVTGTGTDIGKTFVTAGLIRQLRAAGRSVRAVKPVLTGFDPIEWENSDPAVLLSTLGQSITLEEITRISPWRFKAPLSPNMAAEREGRTIAFDEVVEFCRQAAVSYSGTVLIEGIGGIMVPLDDDRTVLDWISVLRSPIILVTGTYVGTISHTLTALEVVARRNIDVTAVAVSESVSSAASLDDTVATLGRFADSIDVIGIARVINPSRENDAFARLAALI